jgi:hypothetical protein
MFTDAELAERQRSAFVNHTSKMTEVHISTAVKIDNVWANLPESGDVKVVFISNFGPRLKLGDGSTDGQTLANTEFERPIPTDCSNNRKEIGDSGADGDRNRAAGSGAGGRERTHRLALHLPWIQNIIS